VRDTTNRVTVLSIKFFQAMERMRFLAPSSFLRPARFEATQLPSVIANRCAVPYELLCAKNGANLSSPRKHAIVVDDLGRPGLAIRCILTVLAEVVAI